LTAIAIEDSQLEACSAKGCDRPFAGQHYLCFRAI
jgi:hypothetical protein